MKCVKPKNVISYLSWLEGEKKIKQLRTIILIFHSHFPEGSVYI